MQPIFEGGTDATSSTQEAGGADASAGEPGPEGSPADSEGVSVDATTQDGKLADGEGVSTDATTLQESSVPTDARGPHEASGPPPPPPSCTGSGPGISDCGPGEACCATSPVPGGTFFLSYDGVTAGHTTQSHQASVSTFDLDVFDVTVGRFRKFVAAVVGGFDPAAGSGKHTHLHGGKGLADSSSAGAYETGWDTSWNGNLPATASAWTAALQCDSSGATWTATAGSNERLPITCVNWYQAYAFCIWDGGFLPSEAEWNFAASGGENQRVYPWSSPPSSQTIDCTYANYFGGAGGSDYCVNPGVGGENSVGSEEPMGDGERGQTDLSGNVFQWTMDANAAYAATCADCADLTAAAGSTRSIRGGAFNSGPPALLAAERNSQDPVMPSYNTGVRCARAPYGVNGDP